MHGIRVTEKVVHISQYLLIGSHEEYAYIIGLLVVERMYGKVRVRSVRRDEIIDFSVGIASNVLYGRCAVGTLVEPTDGHDGEKLVDRP